MGSGVITATCSSRRPGVTGGRRTGANARPPPSFAPAHIMAVRARPPRRVAVEDGEVVRVREIVASVPDSVPHRRGNTPCGRRGDGDARGDERLCAGVGLVGELAEEPPSGLPAPAGTAVASAGRRPRRGRHRGGGPRRRTRGRDGRYPRCPPRRRGAWKSTPPRADSVRCWERRRRTRDVVAGDRGEVDGVALVLEVAHVFLAAQCELEGIMRSRRWSVSRRRARWR